MNEQTRFSEIIIWFCPVQSHRILLPHSKCKKYYKQKKPKSRTRSEDCSNQTGLTIVTSFKSRPYGCKSWNVDTVTKSDFNKWTSGNKYSPNFLVKYRLQAGYKPRCNLYSQSRLVEDKCYLIATSSPLWFRIPRTMSCKFLSRTLSRFTFIRFKAMVNSAWTKARGDSTENRKKNSLCW